MSASFDWMPVALTLELAGVTTLILLLTGTPLAWWLARTPWRGKAAIEALVTLPLVLPPTVLGFYLLLLLGRNGPLAPLAEMFDLRLVFSFTGLVIGSVIFSCPFVVNPLKDAFHSLPQGNLDAAATLGASPVDRFLTVAVPLAWPGYLTASVMGFAHTLGEFGVVLMIGGNIPGETQVLSIAVYNHVEQLEYAQAHAIAAALLLVTFVALTLLYLVARRRSSALL